MISEIQTLFLEVNYPDFRPSPKIIKHIAKVFSEAALEIAELKPEFTDFIELYLSRDDLCNAIGANRFVTEIYLVVDRLPDNDRQRILSSIIENYSRYKVEIFLATIVDLVVRKYPLTDALRMFEGNYKICDDNGREGIKFGINILKMKYFNDEGSMRIITHFDKLIS